MVTKALTITNKEGLHLRPTGKLCEAIYKYKSKIEIVYHSKTINAKSVLSVLSAGIDHGEEIVVVCAGEDEREALETFEKTLAEL